MKALAIACLLAAAAVAGAQPAAPPEFKGIALGINEARLRDTFPFFRCETAVDAAHADRRCAIDPQHPAAAAFASVDGAPLRDVVANFVDDRLVQLTVAYDSDDFARVDAALEAKLGAPARTDSVVTNRRGAHIPNAVSRWLSSRGTVENRHYGASLDRAMLTLSVPDYVALVQRRQLEAIKAGMKVQ